MCHGKNVKTRTNVIETNCEIVLGHLPPGYLLPESYPLDMSPSGHLPPQDTYINFVSELECSRRYKHLTLLGTFPVSLIDIKAR